MKLKHLLFMICGSLSVLFTPFSMATTEATDQTQVEATAVQSDKVNLNTATAEQLQKGLVGIGAKKAQAIVEYRDQHGPFVALEQLTEVKGIGSAIFEKNKERMTIE
ncbi:ComEA family DNA-binding protein [Gallibacterium genomosp. 3]|uniref:Competence protein ComE n=1 Tax=Gallibacterium genomosp. 3 TaxID=505345 RepID=A0A1A7Q6R7_9PAST|nr:ComEA family DNA-binding protein [Gallibacterium genomosp. 3]OBX10548.1 competence protein ComE [Gallibacterium genomosp. 3]